ncbi:polyprenyl synthetase family protein [Streptomyces sp. NPDC046977]|uniref:polyprenyl synthetase family protein n=1 Tax=Streptomyces sp. NPDC046977 TaxID=3154703 RepID=UPI00340B2514
MQHYFDVIADKTGVLVAGAGRIGALVGGADPTTVEAIGMFGERIGAAFQITDDVLDITGAGRDFRKAPGTDLRQAVQTLPLLILHAMPPDTTNPEDARLRKLVSSGISSDHEVEEALRLLRSHQALRDARARLVHLVDEATGTLQSYTDAPPAQRWRTCAVPCYGTSESLELRLGAGMACEGSGIRRGGVLGGEPGRRWSSERRDRWLGSRPADCRPRGDQPGRRDRSRFGAILSAPGVGVRHRGIPDCALLPSRRNPP